MGKIIFNWNFLFVLISYVSVYMLSSYLILWAIWQGEKHNEDGGNSMCSTSYWRIEKLNSFNRLAEWFKGITYGV